MLRCCGGKPVSLQIVTSMPQNGQQVVRRLARRLYESGLTEVFNIRSQLNRHPAAEDRAVSPTPDQIRQLRGSDVQRPH